MTFADLPPELTAKIGQYLPRCDLLELSLTCQGARNAIKHLIFHRISVRSDDLSVDSDLANALINDQVICSVARDLKIVHTEGNATEILYYCMLRLRELESLSIEIHERDRPKKVDDKFVVTDSEEYHGIKDVQQFTAVCTRMKTLRYVRLEIENDALHNDTAGHVNLIHPLPPIEKLHLVWKLKLESDSASIQFVQRLLARAADTLTHFTWDVSAYLPKTELRFALKHIPNVVHLNLLGSSAKMQSLSEVDQFLPIVACFSKLESLHFGFQYLEYRWGGNPRSLASMVPRIQLLCASCQKLSTCIIYDHYYPKDGPKLIITTPFTVNRGQDGTAHVTIQWQDWMENHPMILRHLGSALVRD